MCEALNLDGSAIFICCGHATRRRCYFCGRAYVEKLCDFPINTKGKTCDRGMCNRCATNVGPDRDYCPDHKGKQPIAQQGVLFEEVR